MVFLSFWSIPILAVLIHPHESNMEKNHEERRFSHAIPTTSFKLVRLTYPHFWQKGLSKLALVTLYVSCLQQWLKHQENPMDFSGWKKSFISTWCLYCLAVQGLTNCPGDLWRSHLKVCGRTSAPFTWRLKMVWIWLDTQCKRHFDRRQDDFETKNKLSIFRQTHVRLACCMAAHSAQTIRTIRTVNVHPES